MYVAGGLLCVGKEKNGGSHFMKALSPHLLPEFCTYFYQQCKRVYLSRFYHGKFTGKNSGMNIERITQF